MKKVLIWGTGRCFDELRVDFLYYEMIEDFQIIGVTSNDIYIKKLHNYPFFHKSEIEKLEYDYLMICTREHYMEIYREAVAYGISEEKILSAFAIRIPNFKIDYYMRLKNSKVSIISDNCWGGMAYRALMWEFNSPFIGTYVPHNDYFRLLNNLKEWMGEQIIHKGECFFEYYLGDSIRIQFPHIFDYRIIEDKWIKRLQRINWENIFVKIHTESIQEAEEFEKLPFSNKVCFVPFETDLPSCFVIETQPMVDLRYRNNSDLWHTISNDISGQYRQYDLLALMDGKFQRI